MSVQSRKCQESEYAVCAALMPYGTAVFRPRTTSITGRDIGDIHGLPLVVSVKNQKTMALAGWVDEMAAMVRRSPWDTGVVIHKRVRKAGVLQWYATTNVELLLPMLSAYAEAAPSPYGVLDA